MIHGHKKTDKKKSEEQIKEENDLSNKINNKLAEFFSIRKEPIVDTKLNALIEFTTILMQLCPDITTVFNYRRELVEKVIENLDAAGKAKTLAGDIKLITKIMQSDPKSYTLWSYREWLVVKLFNIDPSIINKEKELCSMLLTKDEKNFHVWNYRNWLNTIKMNIDEELEFTKAKINSNPFNFSPYHFRSKYLHEKYCNNISEMSPEIKKEIVVYGMPKQVFQEELEKVREAIFIRPKEEAPWLYYNWLLKQLLPIILFPITNSDPVTFELLFSQSVNNLERLFEKTEIEFSGEQNKWKAHSTKEGVVLNLNSLENQVDQGHFLMSHRVVNANNDILQEVKAIYEEQETFVKEVLESEENECRFAWQQLLEILKLYLNLGTSEERWNEVIEKAKEAFGNLENEEKGKKYFAKQKLEWERLGACHSLTEVEQNLRKMN